MRPLEMENPGWQTGAGEEKTQDSFNNTTILLESQAFSFNLHPAHLADLQQSDLTDETIRAAGIYTVTPGEIGKKLGALSWNFPPMAPRLLLPQRTLTRT